MATGEHRFAIRVNWTGNRGDGTSGYRAYGREHEITGAEKVLAIPASSAPAFRGNKERYNPEELVIAALSGCHMLWFLHLCTEAGVIVNAYADDAEGTLQLNGDGSGEFREVVLRPRVRYAQQVPTDEAQRLHHRAHELCFIARSVNFPVRCEPASSF